MQTVIYAANRLGYRVQVLDGGQIAYEYSAGNHQQDSQIVVDPRSPGAVPLRQLKRWARKAADRIAKERGVPANQVEYDPDLG